MLPQQREALDEIIIKRRVGRITRRSFLERAVSIGLASTVAVSLLDACDRASNNPNVNKKSPVITWVSEHDSSDIYYPLVNDFNTNNKDGIHVVYVNGAIDTGQLRSTFVNMFQARKGSVDVLSMDVIWPAEFASKKWVLSLDQRWPQNERQNYLPGTVEACIYNNHLWAVPYRVGVGLIYYRTDLVSAPADTWEEMAIMAAHVLHEEEVKYGYIWQGAKYEGLVCDFVEVLYGYGGAILTVDAPQKVVVNSPEAVQALTEMVSWVGTISPKDITTYKEEDTRVSWQNGDAAFMRQWPRVYATANDRKMSKVAGKFDVHPMLYGDKNISGHSCVGGELLGINAYSQQPDAAWQFIQYMIQSSTQKNIALKSSLSTSLKSTYEDPDVLAKSPYIEKFRSAFQSAKPRPVSPRYPEVTDAIQTRVYDALTQKYTPAEALMKLEADLRAIVKS